MLQTIKITGQLRNVEELAFSMRATFLQGEKSNEFYLQFEDDLNHLNQLEKIGELFDVKVYIYVEDVTLLEFASSSPSSTSSTSNYDNIEDLDF